MSLCNKLISFQEKLMSFQEKLVSYQDNLVRYKQLKDDLPNERLIQGCVTRYEKNLIDFNSTQDSKYEIILNTIGNILETFMDINFYRSI